MLVQDQSEINFLKLSIFSRADHDANFALGNGFTANVNDSSHVLQLQAAIHLKGNSAKAAERIVDGLSKVTGNLIDVFTQIECANYFAAEFDAD